MIIIKLKQFDLNIEKMTSTTMNELRKRNVSFEADANEIRVSEKNDLLAIEFLRHQRNFSLVDPSRLSQFDELIKFYCDILNRWGLFHRRIEIFEFIGDKPSEMDDKFG